MAQAELSLCHILNMRSTVFDIIKDRYSVRDYDEKPIEKEKLDIILESGRLAPSSSNSQPWHFYIVSDKEKIAEIGGKMPLGTQVVINSFIEKAPVVIVATAGSIDLLHKAMSFVINKRWHYLDVAIALEHMVLTAWELGIGSCWIGWFDEKKIKKVLNIPKNEEVVAMLTLGYTKQGISHHKSRKSVSEVFKFIP
jgi:nitroreductase